MQSRTRLDHAAVIQAGATLADAEGLEQLTRTRLARHLGIQTPSLYNHVTSLASLRHELTVLGLNEVNNRLARAVIGKSGDAAVAAMAQAYRAFAKEHPGLYVALVRAPDPTDEEMKRAAASVVDVIVAVLAAYGLEGNEAIHAVRVMRSALHGFVTLEASGGFGIPLDLDESFRRLIQIVIGGLHRA